MLKKIRSFLFENKTAKQTVAKNTVWLTISNFGGRAIKAIIVIYGARVLGTAGWGVFSYAVTLAGFFTLFVDPGINSILVRDSSKAEPAERKRLFATTFAIKIVILAVSIAIILGVAPVFSTLPGAKALLPLVALIILFDSIREFFSSLIRSMEKMEWDAGIFLSTNLVIVAAGFLLLRISLTPLSFGWGYVVGTAAGAFMAAYAVRRHFKGIFSSFSPQLILPVLRSAWPFAAMGALGALLTNTDILIISWMRSAEEVGVYSAVIRIVQLLYLVPSIIQFSILPTLSRFAADHEKFRYALERTLGVIFLVSIPLSLGGIVLGKELMGFVFGPAYVAGGLSFSILMGSLLFDYGGGVVSSAIFAYDRQKSLIVASAIGGIANVIFDLMLIPPFGIAGSAVATLLAQIASNSYLWHAMKKINYFSVLPRLKRIALAGALVGVASWLLLLAGTPVFLNIVTCVAFYVALLAIFREPLFIEMRNIIFSQARENPIL